MIFEIIGEVTEAEPIAVGGRIRELRRLLRLYGKGRWRKMKGKALVRLPNGRVRLAELHWYEPHGVGRKEMKQAVLGLKLWARRETVLGVLPCA